MVIYIKTSSSSCESVCLHVHPTFCLFSLQINTLWPVCSAVFTGHHTYSSPLHHPFFFFTPSRGCLRHTRSLTNNIERGEKREGGKHEKRGVEEGWRHVGQGKPLFRERPTVVSLPSHRQTTQQPCSTHKESGVCVCVHRHFHITSGHCCNASQIQASPSQTHPILSNRELCKPMQRPLYSLCYSKLSVGAVDKEMQSGSPLTPGSLCKQYGELLGTLLITL